MVKVMSKDECAVLIQLQNSSIWSFYAVERVSVCRHESTQMLLGDQDSTD